METFLGAALGYRMWRVCSSNHLHGVTGPPWTPGANRACCNYCESSPGSVCHCGFNAFHSVSGVLDYYQDLYGGLSLPVDVIVGAVAGRGDLEIHADGYRSSEAQILLLSDQLFSDKARAREIASLYHVDIISSALDLEQFSLRFAKPVPLEVRPDPVQVEKARQDRSPEGPVVASAVALSFYGLVSLLFVLANLLFSWGSALEGIAFTGAVTGALIASFWIFFFLYRLRS